MSVSVDHPIEHAIQQAGTGEIVPLVREIPMTCPVDFFARLSDYGRTVHSCLFESRDQRADSDAGELTFGTARPALYLTGRGADFRIEALTETGCRMIRFLAARSQRFPRCSRFRISENRIEGAVETSSGILDEQSRLKRPGQMDILRAVAYGFRMAHSPFRVTCGLLGAISYDFIDQFERLPASPADLLRNPDYELYFADNIFLMDHKSGKSFVIVNAMITDDDRDEIAGQVHECFQSYFDALKMPAPAGRKIASPLNAPTTDTSKEQYIRMVEKAQQHIVDGDIFQVVLSRTLMEPCPDEPLDVYRRLRKLNPSPYMFFLNTPGAVLTGSSPELNLRVTGNQQRSIEIRPIAGTKPRGKVKGRIDPDTDFRYEAELKLDLKELAEHMMLVDLARNDIARVSQPGSRVVSEMLAVEKYESVMHLVSNVKGILRDDLDALSAYLATMNMGTLTGAPKIEAMKIIRQLEASKRGYYGGAVLYLTVDGQFDSCITIRSIQIRDRVAYIRAGAGIVYDSVPTTEFDETEFKAQSCLRAIRNGETQ
ncbi:MAG: anthranilate synthase component 1 [Phycisphaerae bacterium]|nr:anthranilate synthase component 1 [Phycisphaerae bacterium]